MVTHSSILAWRIPGTGEPGGLPSMGSHKSRTRRKRLSSSGNSRDVGWGVDHLQMADSPYFNSGDGNMTVFIYQNSLKFPLEKS